MKLSEAWLREYVNPKVNSNELHSQLSLAGLEVDAIEPVGGSFSHVVVGHVVSKIKHPDADKLSVCEVDVGEAKPLQIVCGARNVAAGMKVPVAMVGAVLPGNFKIKLSKLRGVESQGMICSETELGLADRSDGIMPLPSDAPVGQDFRDYWQLDDVTIDIDLTPNRADCLSVLGIAREVGVLNQCKVKAPKITSPNPTIKSQQSAEIAVKQACPRYLTQVIAGIDNTAKLPSQLLEKLRRSGVRSINPVVDITQYVMLLLGQPLHAFDQQKIQGGITVRLANNGEAITLLDDQKITLKDNTLVIADALGSIALAGIMGGIDSGVTPQSTTVVLESAYFAPEAIAGRARQYGLHTDASHRFERGVDPLLPPQAIALASELIVKYLGGAVGPVLEAIAPQYIDAEREVTLRVSQVEQLLGVAISAVRIKSILKALGFALVVEKGDEQVWRAPSFRFDMALEVDLIEEIARIEGYRNIPATLPILPLLPEASSVDKRSAYLSHHLVQQGFYQAITYSFIDAKKQMPFTDGMMPFALQNPLAPELATMRMSLLPGLLEAVSYNLKRQQSRVRLFEVGHCFIPEGEAVSEPLMLAGALCGTAETASWQGSRVTNFYDVKGIVESLLSVSGCLSQCRFEAVTDVPWLHPGQAAQVMSGQSCIGRLGLLHPSLKKWFSLKQEVYLFELDCGQIPLRSVTEYQMISKFPQVRRDIAIELEATIAAATVVDAIKTNGGKHLQQVDIFDVYQGDQVASGNKSLAISLIFQSISHTLEEAEINQAIEKIINSLSNSMGAQLRE